MRVECPGCSASLKFRDASAGRRAKCKQCGTPFRIPREEGEPAVIAARADKAPSQPKAPPAAVGCPECGADMAAGAVLCVSCGYDTRTGRKLKTKEQEESKEDRRARMREENARAGNAEEGFFGPEKRALGKGILGGVAMMVIAVVWFVLGIAAGYIFYYPPILFCIGLYGVIKGIFEGNLRG